MNIDRKLMAYAAGAAAAAAASTGTSADAAIVSSPGFSFGGGSTTNINFDNAGNEEYVLGHRTGPNRVQLLKDDQTIDANAYMTIGANTHPAALNAGELIGPGATYANSYDATLANPTTVEGNFTVDNITGNPQYAGLRFQLTDGGPQYYGWVGIDITNSTDVSGQVTGFAYEDSGNAIAAGAVPEPAGLALLAAGAAVLLRRRPA